MRRDVLEWLECPACQGELETAAKSNDVVSGEVRCSGCEQAYPVLAGVLVLVPDVGGYLLEHVKGIARHVSNDQIPKAYRREFAEARRELVAEHIEEDLEAERVTSLYVMNHYLASGEVRSPSPAISKLIADYWDDGPFARIKAALSKEETRSKKTLVELGCGVGGLLATLGKGLDAYLGLDSSFASIVLARHLALGAPLAGKTLVPQDLLHGTVSREVKIAPPKLSPKLRAEFIVCDLADPPLKRGAWQATAALNVIDMLPDPRTLPRLQHELLAPGGLAIQSCPYVWHADVSAALRAAAPRKVKNSADAVAWLYESAGFNVRELDAQVPWLFFKHERQIELYSVHLFFAKKR